MDDGLRRVFCVMQKQRRTNSKSRSNTRVCLNPLRPCEVPFSLLLSFGHAKESRRKSRKSRWSQTVIDNQTFDGVDYHARRNIFLAFQLTRRVFMKRTLINEEHNMRGI